MKVLIVDDNKDFASTLDKNSGEFINIIDNCNSAFSVAEEIVKKITSERETDDSILLFININLLIKSKKRQDNTGIEILKWLRLKGKKNHCIMYSFLPLISIIKHESTNSILLSKGVTFLQLPFQLPDVSSTKFKELAEKENLLPFFRGDIDPNKIRHELANIWGLIRLKWILDLKDKEEGRNYKIELLKYLNINKDEIQSLNKTNLSREIRWFKENNPKIIYYDDMADLWGPVLKEILGLNFFYYTPQKYSENQLFNLIAKDQPKCLLLDLRLKNEVGHFYDPLHLSGGILLSRLKRRHFSLPVIMFTATNKAESLRRLLKAGAEYIWTKEGVDDGINDNITLQNTIELLYKIKDSVTKFDSETYEKIFEAESKINRIYSIDQKILNVLTNQLKEIRTIIIDTNYLIDSLKNAGYLILFYKILRANNALGRNKKKIIIHEDVYNEIFNISKQNEHSRDERNEKYNEYRVPVTRLLIRLLFDWTKRKLIVINDKEGQSAAIKNISKLNLTDLITPLEKIQIQEKNFFERISELFKNDQVKQIEQLNNQIEGFNKNLNDFSGFNNIKLHADDTLKLIIPTYVKEGSVLFISNDNTCAYNVGEMFIDENNVERYSYKYKTKFNNKEEIVWRDGIKKATFSNGSHYQHLFNSEFSNLFKEY